MFLECDISTDRFLKALFSLHRLYLGVIWATSQSGNVSLGFLTSFLLSLWTTIWSKGIEVISVKALWKRCIYLPVFCKTRVKSKCRLWVSFLNGRRVKIAWGKSNPRRGTVSLFWFWFNPLACARHKLLPKRIGSLKEGGESRVTLVFH